MKCVNVRETESVFMFLCVHARTSDGICAYVRVTAGEGCVGVSIIRVDSGGERK